MTIYEKLFLLFLLNILNRLNKKQSSLEKIGVQLDHKKINEQPENIKNSLFGKTRADFYFKRFREFPLPSKNI